MGITVEEFKAQFPRFTPVYLPVYINGKTYFKDDIVFYNDYFYKVKVASTSNLPTNTTDWELHNDNVLNYTQDTDITDAISEASVNFNCGLFPNKQTAKLVFMFLVAHYLTVDFMNAQGSNFVGIMTSRSVGSVSESYSIPQWIMNNSALAPYSTTGYGIKYCSLIRPYLIGNFFVVKGSINAN